jgi:hypothetical protein
MTEDREFQLYGKEIPYKVPNDFFKTIPEKTLLLARERDKNRRKNRIIWSTVAVAASLAAVFALDFLVQEDQMKPESVQTTLETQTTPGSYLPFEQKIIHQSSGKETKEMIPVGAPASRMSENELLSDVLADLTDEELQQMTAMIKTDPFTTEPPQ